MKFDDWWTTRNFQYDLTIKARFMDCWDDAQRGAAKRCAEICDDSRHEYEAADRIEREFGLNSAAAQELKPRRT